MMWSWCRAAAARASRRKRWVASGRRAKSGRRTLRATRRRRSVSSARKTNPMPPCPSSRSTRKWANRPISPTLWGGARTSRASAALGTRSTAVTAMSLAPSSAAERMTWSTAASRGSSTTLRPPRRSSTSVSSAGTRPSCSRQARQVSRCASSACWSVSSTSPRTYLCQTRGPGQDATSIAESLRGGTDLTIAAQGQPRASWAMCSTRVRSRTRNLKRKEPVGKRISAEGVKGLGRQSSKPSTSWRNRRRTRHLAE